MKQRNFYRNPSYQPRRNSPTIIEGRYYTAHALDRMQDRGIPPSVVEDTIKNNGPIESSDNKKQVYSPSNNITFIINNSGGVVSVRKGK